MNNTSNKMTSFGNWSPLKQSIIIQILKLKVLPQTEKFATEPNIRLFKGSVHYCVLSYFDGAGRTIF